MGALPAFFDAEQTRGLQMALNEFTGAKLKIDGQFGNASIAALKVYQGMKILPQTGRYDSMTATILGSFLAEKYLRHQDFVEAAAVLGCSVAAIKAVAKVEAPSDGFIPDGRCTILFERHKFYAYLAKKKSASEMSRLAVQQQDIISTAPGGYRGGADEYVRFNRALEIDGIAALMSTSWGMFQIMGFNYEGAGYASVGEFVDAMRLNQRNHLKAFVSFIKSESRLLKAIRAQDWTAFAEAYNGVNYSINKYDIKMEAAFDSFQKELGTTA